MTAPTNRRLITEARLLDGTGRVKVSLLPEELGLTTSEVAEIISDTLFDPEGMTITLNDEGDAVFISSTPSPGGGSGAVEVEIIEDPSDPGFFIENASNISEGLVEDSSDPGFYLEGFGGIVPGSFLEDPADPGTYIAGSVPLIDVKVYGAKGDGTTDDTAAIASAASAMIAAGKGILYLPTGTYKVTSLPTFTPVSATAPLTYAVRGDGAELSIIKHYGTTQVSSLTVKNPLFDPNSASLGAPPWSGFTIDGINSSGGCSGLIWGDVSYGSFNDVKILNFASGDGWFFNNPYGWTEGINMRACHSEYNGNQLRFDVGSGGQIGSFSATISSGATFTTISTTALTRALFIGQKIVIAAGNSAIGVTTQTVTVAATASVGATSITVNSATAATTYTSGTAKVYWGGYGSFDYWTIDSLYMQANANQNGIVSEISRGIAENIQRIGSRIRITGNFHTGATNTGYFMWLKGNDTWTDTVWNVNIEVGGATVAHNSVKLSSGVSTVEGNGTFILYGLGPSSFTGGMYQFGVTGQVCVNGITDSAGLAFRQMRRPGFLDVAPGVTPNRGGTSASPVSGQYPNTVANATPWQNTTGFDLLVTLPIAFTGTGTAAWNVDVWNGLPSNLPGGGGAAVTMAAGPSGMTIPLTFIHYNRMWARIDVTNATISAPYVRYHD